MNTLTLRRLAGIALAGALLLADRKKKKVAALALPVAHSYAP